jgi:hypothetical protein
MPSAAVRDRGSMGARQLVRWTVLVMTGAVLQACGGAWTARVCSSNASGNCNGVSPFPKHHRIKSAHLDPVVNGLTDVQVREPDCPNGFGELAVTVVDRDTLDLVVYCLSDRPANAGTDPEGTMTLPAPTDVPPATPQAPQPSQP